LDGAGQRGQVVFLKTLAPRGTSSPPAGSPTKASSNNTQSCIKQVDCGREVQVVLNFAATGQQTFYDYVAAQFDR